MTNRTAPDSNSFSPPAAGVSAGVAFAAMADGAAGGDWNKVLPAELKAASEKEPLLYNKQFYWAAELPAKLVTDPKLADILMDHYRAMRPLNEFLLGPKR